jgi:hypothetical protein
MENKYFTPDIEDFHVGYECEILKENWEHFVFNVEEIIPVFAKVNSKTIVSDKIRVPYLTKEQIEAEGWEHVGGKLLSGDFQDYQKNNFSMRYATDTRKLSIMVRDPSFSNERFQVTILKAECRDINTFRKIIKLLGI